MIVYGQDPTGSNPDMAPSLFAGGVGIADTRPAYSYMPGQGSGQATVGFQGVNNIMTLNAVPATMAANNIAASQGGLALQQPLVLTASAGVTGNVTVTNAANGRAVRPCLAIDGVAGRISYGGSATVQLWDPVKSIARNVRITTAAGDNAVYRVIGFDLYGYPMTENFQAAGATTISGKKAFKYIQSVTPVGPVGATLGATVTVGTGDVVGFPLYSSTFYGTTMPADIAISWAGAQITSTTGYLAGDVTNPATSTTGDVRGTWPLATSDGVKRLILWQSPLVTNALLPGSGLFGVPQV
jgi:hypothetical protein